MNRSRIVLVIFVLLTVVAATAYGGLRWIKIDGTITSQTPEVAISQNNSSSLAFRVHFPGFVVNDIDAGGQLWQRLSFRNMAEHAFPGEPAVPVLSRWVAVPDGAEPVLKVTASGARTIRDINLIPAQAPAPDCYCEDEPGFEIDPTIYSNADAFPGRLFEMEKPVVVRGLRLMRVNLYPVQVRPAIEQAVVYSDFDVTIEFRGSKGRFFTDRRARSFQNVYGLAMNHMAFRSEPLPYLGGKSEGGAEYVIICGPLFEDAAQQLADWKNLQGYDTEVYTTAETGTSVAAIKTWIKNAYDTWDPAPEWILFLGDAEFISPTYDSDDGVASDLYYLTVDGDDEWEDIHSGRISVDTAAQAEKRVTDIINYERDPIDNDSFYTNAYFAAYWQDGGGGYEDRRFLRTSEETYQWFHQFMPNSPFTPHRIYVTDSYVTPLYWNQSYYLWTASWWTYSPVNIVPELLRSNGFAWDGDAGDITAAVNGGTAFITHRDHGEETGWADPAFYVSNVNGLNNGDKLPTVWSINCLTGDYDGETGYGVPDPCFSEAWERNPNGGAVGIMASTELSYSGRNDRMFWGWLDSMWPDFEPDYPTDKANEPEWRQAALMLYGKMYMSMHYADDPYRMIGIEEFHYFGDPTQEMYAGVPGEMEISHLPLLPMGSVSFDVSVDVDNALVSLTQNGVILGRAYSSGGNAHLVFDAPIASTDDVHLVVTRYTYHPYETDIMVGATSDGVVNLDQEVYTEDSTIGVSVSDADLSGEGTYNLIVKSDSEPAGETVVCTEYLDTGTFFGELPVATNSAGDGTLLIANGDDISVTYHDEDTGSGSPADKTDTAYADTAAPTFAGAASAVGGDEQITVTWAAATDLTPPITYQIYRAEYSGGEDFDTPLAETNKLAYIDKNLPNMKAYYYIVRSTDKFGHQDTNTVEVYDMTVGPVTIWEEDFDDKAGIPDDWEIVNGGSASYTWSDDNPCSRSDDNWTGEFVIADSDCSGSGALWNDSLITPAIDASNYTDVKLYFTHDFTFCSGYGDDYAIIDVSNDGGTTWNNVVSWTGTSRAGLEEIDVSTWVDSQANVKFRFTYTGNYDYWWGIDNLQLIGLMPAEPAQIIDFVGDALQGPAPLEVTFTADIDGVVSSLDWNFGDGSEITHEPSPTHTFTTPGIYNVTLTAHGPYGDDEMVKNGYVIVDCPTPTVDFEADVTTGEVPLDVSFTNLSSFETGCEAESIEWDFGDGETSTDTDPVHTYNTPGTYTVTLTYTTTWGDGEYSEAKTAYVTVECGVPDADFSVDVTEGEAPLTVQLTDESVAADACAISSWTWYYGQSLDDMMSVDGQNPAITLTEPGVYHVALRVKNEAGEDQETKTDLITVSESGADDDADDDDDDTDDDVDNQSDDDDDDDDDSGCGC